MQLAQPEQTAWAQPELPDRLGLPVLPDRLGRPVQIQRSPVQLAPPVQREPQVLRAQLGLQERLDRAPPAQQERLVTLGRPDQPERALRVLLGQQDRLGQQALAHL